MLEPRSERMLSPDQPAIVEPEQPHEVDPVGPVRFFIEFYRAPQPEAG